MLLHLLHLGSVALSAASYAHVEPKTTPFYFVAMGDMPYEDEDEPAITALQQRINKTKPTFVVHVGDIKNGTSWCHRKRYRRFVDLFSTLEAPFMLTPGDNEWTDCDRITAGRYDPEERLNVLRSIIYTQNWFASVPFPLESQGQLARQSKLTTDKPHRPYIENLRWELSQHGTPIVFTTLHIVGSNNNRVAGDIKAIKEYTQRNRATNQWMHEAFTDAKRHSSPVVVLMMQADPQFPILNGEATLAQQTSGFMDWYTHLLAELRTYHGHVLLIHGDSHEFVLDTPLEGLNDPQLKGKLTRVIVYGGRKIHAVQVRIAPKQPQPFTVEPLL